MRSVLGDSELKQLATLASLVEKHYGSPQDTEWALSNGKIYLLQARPITTMNSGMKDSDILGTDDKILIKGTMGSLLLRMGMSWCADPLTPLDFACFRKRAMGAIRAVERENGCVAVKMAKLRVFPGIIGRFMSMFFGNLSKSTEEIWRPLSEETNSSLKRLKASVKKTNNAGKLAELMEQAMNEFGALFTRRLGILAAPGFGKDFKLDKIIEKTLGKEETERLEEKLLRALPFKTALQNEAMVNLAQLAAENGKGKGSESFKAAFSRFLEEYGDRPAVNLVAFPGSLTWHESPAFVHSLIDALINDGAYLNAKEGFQRQEAEYETAKKTVEVVLSKGKIQKFRKSLNTARNEIVIREESSFLIERFTAYIRTAALKLGDLLTNMSVINEAGDIFFLLWEELAPAATGKINVRERIERRKKSFEKVCGEHENGTHWMISTGSVAVTGKKKEPTKDTANTLHGVSASRGIIEGTVCVVRNSSEFSKLKKGDVMVSVFTSPAWTPLFKVAAAVITEKGSPTSHAAIVAREYGIPAIVAMDNVTTVLKDGQKIRVDGTSGVVTLLHKDSADKVSALLQEGGKIHAKSY
jgi:pyruvate,water dikinase